MPAPSNPTPLYEQVTMTGHEAPRSWRAEDPRRTDLSGTWRFWFSPRPGDAPQGADARETWYEVTRGLSFSFDEPGNPLLGLVAQLPMGDSPAYVRQRRAAIVSGEPVADRVTVATLTLKLTVDQQRDFRARLDELLGDMTAAADANREEGAETGVVAVTAEFFPVLEK